MVEKRLAIVAVFNGIVVSMILLIGFLFFREITGLFSSLMVLGAIMFVIPIALIRYHQIAKIKRLEDFFPTFMRDLAETVRSGMTLPQAIKAVSENDYGDLSNFVVKLSAQLNWGIPFEKAFLNFTRKTKSRLIGRIGSTIIESHRYGGNLTDIFEAISSTTVEIERLREERKLYLNSQLMSGYIVFFVFLAVIIGLQKFLVPTLSEASVEELGVPGGGGLEQEYNSIFRNLILIQGLFAGLVIGKMSEGAVVGGIKHSLILMTVGGVIHILSAVVF